MFPAILLDVAVVAVLLLFVILGAKKGFVLTLCSLLALVVALLAASAVSNAAAPVVSEAIRPTVERTVSDILADQLEGGNGGTSIGMATEQALDALRDKGGFYAIAADAMAETLVKMDFIPPITQLATEVATAVTEQLARGILFVVVFVLALILWNILSHALDLVAKLPVLNQLNETLGGIAGFVKGVVIAYVAVWVLYSLTGIVTPQMIEGSHVFSFLALHSPMELLTLK